MAENENTLSKGYYSLREDGPIALKLSTTNDKPDPNCDFDIESDYLKMLNQQGPLIDLFIINN